MSFYTIRLHNKEIQDEKHRHSFCFIPEDDTNNSSSVLMENGTKNEARIIKILFELAFSVAPLGVCLPIQSLISSMPTNLND